MVSAAAAAAVINEQFVNAEKNLAVNFAWKKNKTSFSFTKTERVKNMCWI